ncbi:hypothetical protein SCHPADRAFT_842610 [Schizopora paradoxa]|uniref:Uncharacterized protein n=1 Tax=Schizopora paradoxa TaxID=27342 RepID=A0A0H2S8J5_9AGAM|nr:hypothetical protein SCHPADRAFT_842610 [Schizopora paradoxa]
MSDPWSLSITTSDARQRGQTHGRPSHLSVGSLVTNASGLAESTISQGTAWTGESADTAVRISQFPSPPSELPTPTSPTRSAFSFPRSAATSLRKSLSSSLTISSHLPSPTSPSSQIDPTYRASPVPSHSSGYSMASGTVSVGQGTMYEQTAPLKLHKRTAYTAHTPSGSPVSPDKGQSNILTVPPPIREEPSVPLTPKRPPSPSTLAGSSMYDWTDGMSGISVNTGEERLLSTSFITSLLAQTPDPFASAKPPTAWSRHGRNHKTSNASSDGTTYVEQSGASSRNGFHVDPPGSREQPSHQSVPQSIHSSEVYVNSMRGSNSLDTIGPPVQHAKPENASIIANSIRTSGDYSETLHSEEQVQSLVRSPSVLAKSQAARAVGITPAYRVSYVGESKGLPDSAGNSIMTASSTISPLPPVHRADVPLSVRAHHKFFDGENIPRESEEDFGRKMGSMSLDMDGYDLGQSLDLPNSPALPSTAGTESRFTDAQTDSRRQSRRQLSRNQSMRSVVSSMVSRISNTSSARRTKYMAWLKKRPLPPLPSSTMPRTLPFDPHNAEIQKYEEDIPLPTLAKRAVALEEFLDEGDLSNGIHHRPKTQHYKEIRTDNGVRQSQFQTHQDEVKDVDHIAVNDSKEHAERRGIKSWLGVAGGGFTTTSPSKSALPLFKRSGRFRVIIVACLVFGIVLAIAVPVGVTRHKKSSSTLPTCPGNTTGAACNLDATCVCTGASGSSCKPLAQSLVNLIPTVNSFFAANFTGSSLSDSLFNAQGSNTGSNCARQAILVDVAPGLQQSQFPNRTMWAQSVILWNLGLSQDLNATTVLQTFVAKQAQWSSLGSSDGIVPDAAGTFSITASGLIFDFAAQTISPVSTSFRDDANPTAAQLSELTASNTQILDRMYSFAKASSLQRQHALNTYWTTTLQQQSTDLPRFIAAITSSPFLLPFDATVSNVTTLMTNSTGAQFPPPLACYPSLSSSQLNRLNAIEVSVFGLSPATVPSQFDTSCFPTRPAYGVVDVLGLRLPFTDDRQGVGKQASLLSGDAQKRAILYSGEILSALPGASSLPTLTNASTDPREYGTSNNINHVLLNYLSSISDVTLAMELVQFILSGSSTPPSNSSSLSSSLSSLPVLEFAIFGSITPPDLLSSVSSFSAPDRSLFFGSDAGQTFRSWALVESSESIAWAQSATSPTIVREGATPNSNFESVWTPASQLVHAGSTNASDVAKVTQSLQSLGLFSSS